MTYNEIGVFQWVLFESNAPKEIRERAFRALTDKTQSNYTINGHKITERDWEILQDHSRKKHKIQAIKHYREITGAALKEAKIAIETYFPNLSPKNW